MVRKEEQIFRGIGQKLCFRQRIEVCYQFNFCVEQDSQSHCNCRQNQLGVWYPISSHHPEQGFGTLSAMQFYAEEAAAVPVWQISSTKVPNSLSHCHGSHLFRWDQSGSWEMSPTCLETLLTQNSFAKYLEFFFVDAAMNVPDNCVSSLHWMLSANIWTRYRCRCISWIFSALFKNCACNLPQTAALQTCYKMFTV